MAQAKAATDEPRAASSSAIMQALSPYMSSGPSGIAVQIGQKEITLKREQRRFVAPRQTPVEDLIDAAVDMSGPLTPEEVENLFKPYEAKGVTMKIDGNMVYLTRKAHIASIRTGENKVKQIHMKERTVSSSLDVPMAHIIGVLSELVSGSEVFE